MNDSRKTCDRMPSVQASLETMIKLERACQLRVSREALQGRGAEAAGGKLECVIHLVNGVGKDRS